MIKNILYRYLIQDVIPEEISTSRLFCLNKKANEPGKVNNIRSIAISSTLLKITELNLLKLRQRIYDIKGTKNQYDKY